MEPDTVGVTPPLKYPLFVYAREILGGLDEKNTQRFTHYVMDGRLSLGRGIPTALMEFDSVEGLNEGIARFMRRVRDEKNGWFVDFGNAEEIQGAYFEAVPEEATSGQYIVAKRTLYPREIEQIKPWWAEQIVIFCK